MGASFPRGEAADRVAVVALSLAVEDGDSWLNYKTAGPKWPDDTSEFVHLWDRFFFPLIASSGRPSIDELEAGSRHSREQHTPEMCGLSLVLQEVGIAFQLGLLYY
jgi:hypothetical protein